MKTVGFAIQMLMAYFIMVRGRDPLYMFHGLMFNGLALCCWENGCRSSGDGGGGSSSCDNSTTRGHNKQDQILLVKIAKYIVFCVYRRSYLLWSPVIGVCGVVVVLY